MGDSIILKQLEILYHGKLIQCDFYNESHNLSDVQTSISYRVFLEPNKFLLLLRKAISETSINNVNDWNEIDKIKELLDQYKIKENVCR